MARITHEETASRLLVRAGWFGVAGSLLMHAAFVASVIAVTTRPPPMFELRVPVNVVLGLTDPTEASGPTAAGSAPESAGGRGPGAGAGAMDAGVPPDAYHDASVGEGGVPGDGGMPTDASRRRRRRDGGVDAPVDGGAPLVASEEGEGASAGGSGRSPVAFLPAGAQVALRADLDLARASPVRREVDALLSALPDWRILLGSSALDPVRDFSRVLIATPDFDRAHLVVAGRLAEGTANPRALADELAAGRGDALTWTDEDGIAQAPWSVDDTARTLAIVGPRHFVVCRNEDLPRVLANAAVRADGAADEPADALLSMREGEALSLEIEGAEHYVVAGTFPCVTPRSLRISMRTRDVDGVDLLGEARFTSAALATEAAACLTEVIGTYAANPFVGALGFGRPLHALQIEADGRNVVLRGDLTYTELRRILGLIGGFFAERPRRGPPSAPGTASPAPPPAPPAPPP